MGIFVSKIIELQEAYDVPTKTFIGNLTVSTGDTGLTDEHGHMLISFRKGAYIYIERISHILSVLQVLKTPPVSIMVDENYATFYFPVPFKDRRKTEGGDYEIGTMSVFKWNTTYYEHESDGIMYLNQLLRYGLTQKELENYENMYYLPSKEVPMIPIVNTMIEKASPTVNKFKDTLFKILR